MSRSAAVLLLWPSIVIAWVIQDPDELPHFVASDEAAAPDPLIPFVVEGEFQTFGSTLSPSTAILTQWSEIETKGFKLMLNSGQLKFSVALFDGSGHRTSSSQQKVLDDGKLHKFQAVVTTIRIQVIVDSLYGYSSDGGCSDEIEADVDCGFGLFDSSLSWVIGGNPCCPNEKFNGTLRKINVARTSLKPQKTAADPDSTATPAPSPQVEKNETADVLIYAIGIPLLLVVLAVLIIVAAVGTYYLMRRTPIAAAASPPSASPAGTASPAPTRSSGPAKLVDEPILPPSSWTQTDVLPPGGLALAQASSELRQTVQELMDNTWRSVVTRDRTAAGSHLSRQFEVVQVLRNENMKLWREYVLKRRSIRTKLSTDDIRVTTLTDSAKPSLDELETDSNECYLFHGSKPSSIQDICKNDFMLKLAGGHRGTLYGRGVYFAESSSKADEYAEDDRDGIYKGIFAMLLCRVTLGRPLVTEEVRPDTARLEAACKGPRATHHSVLGDREKAVGTYREFVVFDSTQVYPEFSILYRRNDP